MKKTIFLLFFCLQQFSFAADLNIPLGESKLDHWQAFHVSKDNEHKIVFKTDRGDVIYQPEDSSSGVLSHKVIHIDKLTVLVTRWQTGNAETIVILDPTVRKSPVVFELISDGPSNFDYNPKVKKIKINYVSKLEPEKAESQRPAENKTAFWPQ